MIRYYTILIISYKGAIAYLRKIWIPEVPYPTGKILKSCLPATD